MARDPVKQKIVRVLRAEFLGAEDRIIIKDGFEDLLDLYVVSRKFRGKRSRERIHLVWDVLSHSLSEEEQNRVSMIETLLPQEAKNYWPPMPELNRR